MKTLVVEEICCLAGTAAARGDPARAARLAAVAELHQLAPLDLKRHPSLTSPERTSKARRLPATRRPGSKPGQQERQ